MSANSSASNKSVFWAIVIAAFGYFVDIYDIFIYNVVRVKCSADLLGLDLGTLSKSEIKELISPYGDSIHNIFLLGMILGSLAWGIIADYNGRKFVLLSTILIYSLTTLATAFVNNSEVFYWMRFIAGFGLAGELGAGITLVSELVKKEERTKTTMIIASVGLLGVVFAGIVGQLIESWRYAFALGGIMGLALFAVRFFNTVESTLSDSNLFDKQEKQGFGASLIKLWGKPKSLLKFLQCVLTGMALNVTAVLLIGKTTEFSIAFGWKSEDTSTLPQAGWALSVAYTFLSLGDLFFAWLAIKLNSRKKAILWALAFQFVAVFSFLTLKPQTLILYYTFCGIIGFTLGYWSNILANVSEQFGTDVRATATTAVPNFQRGTTAILTIVFGYMVKKDGPFQLDWISTAYILWAFAIGAAIWSVYLLKDKINDELDFIE
jgi:MFS transporter, putative metabolite:H+ symporter